MKSDFLARVPLFAALEPPELERLRLEAETVAAAAGDFLFRRGDPGDALYIVETGLLEAVIDEGTPTERTLNALFPGDFFGEMALLTQGPRTASVRSLVDSRLVRISYRQFASMLDLKPAMALHLSKVLSHYLSRTNEQLSRQAARIVALVPACFAPPGRRELAGRLAASLTRQFGRASIVVELGGEAQSGDEDRAETAVDAARLLDGIRPLPGGGHALRIGEAALRAADDPALVGILNGLRSRFGYILVCADAAEARRRLAILTRVDRTFLLCGTFDRGGAAESLASELSQALRGRLRAAWIAPPGDAPPPLAAVGGPPVKVRAEGGEPAQEGVDRLARAMAGLTVGLALGSGTAQGLSHLGVMQALIEAAIPFDLIAGTSGGALYGSMVASGMTIEESVRNTIRETRRNLIDKLDFAVPTRGIIRGARIERMVRSIIGDVAFEEVPIPLYAVAADLDTGEEVVLREGPVYRGVRASISVPGIFEPYPLNGRILVDGVVVNPLPVSVARAMGADIVVGVQVPAPGKVNMEAGARAGRKRRNEYSLISSIIRSHHFVGERLADQSAADADVFIKPDVTRFGWREYRAAPEIIAEGVKAGEAAVKQIRALIRGGVPGIGAQE